MQKMFNNRKIVTVFSFVCLVVLGYSCQKALDKNSQLAEQKAGKSQEGGGIAKPPQLTKNFQQVNLVSSTTEYPALLLDPTLLNPWGLTFNGTGAIAWPASQASGLSQLYSYNPTAPSVTRVRAVGIPTFNAETGWKIR